VNEFDDPLNAYTSGMANHGGFSIAGGQGLGNVNAQSMMYAPTAPSLPTGGIRTAFHTGILAAAPAPKKARAEDQVAPTPLSLMMQQQQQQAMASQMLQGRLFQGTLPQQLQQPNQTQNASVAASGGIALPVGVGIRLGGNGGVAPSMAQAPVGQFGTGLTHYSHTAAWNNNEEDPAEAGMSEHAVAERRQRNREHAKRSRVRKKFMLESLQEQVRALQRENNGLRMLVQQHIPENAMQIISDICTSSPLFSEDTGSTQPMSSAGGDTTGSLERTDFCLMQSLASGQKCFVLSDPKLPDNPIVFATPDFYRLTGYSSEQVLGRNCRFLQGPGTDKRAIDVIRKAIATGNDATVCLINYKADGTPFWNQFFIAALRDSDNNIVNFVRCRHDSLFFLVLILVSFFASLQVGVQTEVEPETAGASNLEDKVNAVLPLQFKE
jgi:PAS domain S-box-containing protein